MSRPKIAVIASHPIQHFCPMYVQWAKLPHWDLRVFFASDMGAKPYFDKAFGKEIQWTNLQLDRFPHEFLNDQSSLKRDISRIDSEHLESRLTAYKPDILIIYGYSQPLQRRALRWATRTKTHVLMISDADLSRQKNPVILLTKKILLPSIMQKLSGCLTVGDNNEDYYLHYGIKSICLFRSPFPIDIDLYREAYARYDDLRLELRKKMGIEDHQIVISMVGKFDQGKRQRDLIQAMQLTLSLPPKSLVLVLIGSGALENELRLFAEKVTRQRILFTGFIQPDELPAYYAASDIYAHVSSEDHHPLSISEAMYMGCPVIASDIIGSVGSTDDVQRGRNGLTFPTGDIKQLAYVITSIAQSVTLRQYFRQNSHKIAVKHQELAHGEGLYSAVVALGYSP